MEENSALNVETATGTQMDQAIAGPGSRAYAFVIDWHIRVVIILVYWLVLTFVPLLAGWNPWTEPTDQLIWMGVPASVVYLLYHPVVELLMGGNSPGKIRAGVRVVDQEGLPPSTGAILLRNVFRIIDSLPVVYSVGFIATLVTRNHVRLGDLVAGTLLVVSEERLEAAMTRIQQVQGAGVDARTAELVLDLLERWSGLASERRRALATQLLEQHGLDSPARDGELRDRLKQLINT